MKSPPPHNSSMLFCSPSILHLLPCFPEKIHCLPHGKINSTKKSMHDQQPNSGPTSARHVLHSGPIWVANSGPGGRATRQLVGLILSRKRWAAVWPLIEPLSKKEHKNGLQ